MGDMKTWLRNNRSILLGGLIGLLGALGFLAGLFGSATFRATDRFFLTRPADPHIVIVAIDDASLGRIGRWPWPRTVHAQLVKKLSDAGALAIGYDVNFPEPSDVESDQALADAMHAAGNVVLPIELELALKQGRFTFAPNTAVESITRIQSAAHSAGHTNVPLDDDGVARRLPLTVEAADGSHILAFSYEVGSVAGQVPPLSQVPTDAFGQLTINYPGHPRQSFRVVSAADIIQGTADPAIFKNAIVFVGATAHDLHDEQYVPTSSGEPMSGVEIHASALDTLVQRRWLVAVPSWIEFLALIAMGAFLGFLIRRVRARTSALAALGLWIGWILVAFAAFDAGHILDIVWPTIVIAFVYAALLLERWLDTEKRRRDLRTVLSRYVTKSVVDAIMRDPTKLKLGGDRRRMSVLFSDLRGFTTLSEGMTPEQLVEVLNRYLHEMTMIVFEQHGVLDKYIGDAVMAFWNAPFDQPDHAKLAVRAAVRMKDKLAEMNKGGKFPPGIVLKVGVGVNTGDMVVGNVGGELRYDYTVIGDSVNLASRTEGLNKEYGTEIIVTESTMLELGDEFLLRKLDKVAVKGKKEPIMIYQVMSLKTSASEPDTKLAQQFEHALAAYFDQKFAEAKTQCEEILKTWPDDGATKSLLARCTTYQACPPLVGWDGTWVMTKK